MSGDVLLKYLNIALEPQSQQFASVHKLSKGKCMSGEVLLTHRNAALEPQS